MKFLVILVVALLAFTYVNAQTDNLLTVLNNAGLTSFTALVANNTIVNGALTGTTKNHTVFAPTNTALVGFTPGTGFYPDLNATVTNLLTETVPFVPVAGQPNRAAVSLQGASLRITNYVGQAQLNQIATINGQTLSAQLPQATNGFAYSTGAVIYPSLGTITTALSRLPQYSELFNLITTKSGLVQTLMNTPDYTIFAPNNAAFVALNATLISRGLLLANLTQNQTDTVLLNHILVTRTTPNFPIFSSAVNTNTGYLNSTTLLGTANVINITVVSSTFRVTTTGGSSANVVNADIVFNNGVIHGIDSVLVPANFLPPAPTPGPTSTPGPTPSTTGSSTTGSSTTSSSSIVTLNALLFVVAVVCYFF